MSDLSDAAILDLLFRKGYSTRLMGSEHKPFTYMRERVGLVEDWVKSLSPERRHVVVEALEEEPDRRPSLMKREDKAPHIPALKDLGDQAYSIRGPSSGSLELVSSEVSSRGKELLGLSTEPSEGEDPGDAADGHRPEQALLRDAALLETTLAHLIAQETYRISETESGYYTLHDYLRGDVLIVSAEQLVAYGQERQSLPPNAEISEENQCYDAFCDSIPEDWSVPLLRRIRDLEQLRQSLDKLRCHEVTTEEVWGIKMDALPTFGGDRPTDTWKVWSWDKDSLLVGDSFDSLEIVPRDGRVRIAGPLPKPRRPGSKKGKVLSAEEYNHIPTLPSREIAEAIQNHSLAVRRVPFEIRSTRRNRDGEFYTEVRVPAYPGWWMCQKCKSSATDQPWDLESDHLAPSLGQSIALYLHLQQSKSE